jgi:hypothetical protein
MGILVSAAGTFPAKSHTTVYTIHENAIGAKLGAAPFGFKGAGLASQSGNDV